jgi:hypothetical protein
MKPETGSAVVDVALPVIIRQNGYVLGTKANIG